MGGMFHNLSGLSSCYVISALSHLYEFYRTKTNIFTHFNYFLVKRFVLFCIKCVLPPNYPYAGSSKSHKDLMVINVGF